MKQLWMLMLSVGLGAGIMAGTVVADDDVVLNSDVTQVESELFKQVKAQRITVEQAKEMGLNRAETYEVASTVSVENLELQLAEKLKDSIMPYYSIEYNDPTNDDNAYRAMVTEYFGKVE